MLSYIRPRMLQLSLPTSRLDRIAMGLSGLCLVHCVATAVLLGLVASAGGLLGSPAIHEVGLTLAMIFGSIALVRGIFEHGFTTRKHGHGFGLHSAANAAKEMKGTISVRSTVVPVRTWIL